MRRCRVWPNAWARIHPARINISAFLNRFWRGRNATYASRVKVRLFEKNEKGKIKNRGERERGKLCERCIVGRDIPANRLVSMQPRYSHLGTDSSPMIIVTRITMCDVSLLTRIAASSLARRRLNERRFANRKAADVEIGAGMDSAPLFIAKCETTIPRFLIYTKRNVG